MTSLLDMFLDLSVSQPPSSLVGLADFHDAFRHLLHIGVVEDQRRGQLNSQMLLEAIAEGNSGEAVHAAVHEWAIFRNLVLEADGRLRHLMDHMRHLRRVQSLGLLLADRERPLLDDRSYWCRAHDR